MLFSAAADCCVIKSGLTKKKKKTARGFLLLFLIYLLFWLNRALSYYLDRQMHKERKLKGLRKRAKKDIKTLLLSVFSETKACVPLFQHNPKES